MSWLKLDDRAPRHPKVASLTDRAFRWWIQGLCYASEFLTNGVLPPIFWKQVPKQNRAELTGNNLWDWDDPNFQIHDYLHHQTRKEDVEADKQRNREKVAAFRERRRAERRKGVTGNGNQPVTGYVLPESNHPVTDPDNREQITENRLQTQSKEPPPAKPLISGQANPRDWGRIHGNHETGFCDWVCLPDFVFEEFRCKSGQTSTPDGGRAYVRGWALKVRDEWGSRPIGEDGLKFWRARWAESHATKPAGPKPINIQEILDKEAARKAAQR